MNCGYCFKPRTNATGWHDCGRSVVARQRIGRAITAIYELNAGGPERDESDDEYRRLSNMAVGIRLMGGKVRDNYKEML